MGRPFFCYSKTLEKLEDSNFPVFFLPFFSMYFCKSVTFASNSFIVCLLGKVMVPRKVSLSITTPKQVVLVVKEWYFTVKERPSTIPKQLVLLSKETVLHFTIIIPY